MEAPSREEIVRSFRLQIGGCRLFGSELYHDLLRRAQADYEAGGPVARLIDGWTGDPLRGFLPLRILGAVHERVLAGEAPGLAPFYPSVGGRADAEAAWPAFLDVIDRQVERLRPRLASFPQTNEVRRSAGLLPGFLHVARRTGLPLRVREIGCSAGLNLCWDRFHYRLGEHRWGDPESPVRITAEWSGGSADWSTPVRVESRAGCDLEPRDFTDDDDVRSLESYVWPDQPERLEQLRAAVALARLHPPRVERARARDWLPGQLSAPAEGVCRTLFHSSVWIYLSAGEQAELTALLEDLGSRATPRTPLAWLRHEDGARPGTMELRVRIWPGGQDEHLAMGHPHGRFVEWLPPVPLPVFE